MIVGFHPVFDNPVRMGYVAGWTRPDDLLQRLGDLDHAIGECRVVPATWEPFHRECPSCRYAGAYAWAQSRLQNPHTFAQALPLFPGEPQLATPVGQALRLILRSKSEPSRVTRKLMLREALETWESHADPWLEQVVATCAACGMVTSLESLQQHVQQALQPLAKEPPPDDDGMKWSDGPLGFQRGHGFDKELLQMDGWTPNPGLIILPVDGPSHALTRQILRLDLGNVVLLSARKSARIIAWEKVTLVHLFEGTLMFEMIDEPSLRVAGYQHPEHVLTIVQECYRAATERLLQALATKVIHTTP